MSIFLVLSNVFFCTLALLFIIPLLMNPNFLLYKNGIFIYIIMILFSLNLLIPHEFFFTQSLPSKNILPVIKKISGIKVKDQITIEMIFLFLWFFIATIRFLHHISKQREMKKIMRLVKVLNNEELIQILSEPSIKKQIRGNIKILQLDIATSPFVVGVFHSIIVIPNFHLSKSELRFILLHELAHIKNHHIVLKMFIEVVANIYWWNPFIWLLRRQIICALEIQADSHVIKQLPITTALSYLNVLIKLSKAVQCKSDFIFSFSFSTRSRIIEKRIQTAIKYDCFHKYKFSKILFFPLILSLMIILSSFIFTFEPYKINLSQVAGTFTISDETSYLVIREDGQYDLFIDDQYIYTLSKIPNTFPKLLVID